MPIPRSSLFSALAALMLGACAGMPAGTPASNPVATPTEARPAARSVQTRRPPPAAATIQDISKPRRVVEPPPPDPASNIFFASGSDQVSPAGRRLLQETAEKLKGKVRADVTLVGHTDDAGSTEFNIALAQKRVEAVAGELEALGVSPRQIRRISYGNEATGYDACGTATCRDRERRVELRLSEAD